MLQFEKRRVSFSTLGLAAILTSVGATYGAVLILGSLGFESISTAIKISDAMKILIALYLTGAAISLGLLALALFTVSKRQTRYSGLLGVSVSISAIATVLTPPAFAVAIDFLSASLILVGGILGIVGGVLASRIPSPPSERGLLSTYEIATTAALSALTAILTGVAFVPSPTGGYTHIGDTAIFIASLLFGSKVGSFTGVIGSVAADLWVGYPRWFVSIPAHGLEGLIAGLGRGRGIAIQVVSCALGGIVMASVYFYVNIFIKGWALAVISYARDILGQAAVSLVLAIILARAVQKTLPRFKS